MALAYCSIRIRSVTLISMHICDFLLWHSKLFIFITARYELTARAICRMSLGEPSTKADCWSYKWVNYQTLAVISCHCEGIQIFDWIVANCLAVIVFLRYLRGSGMFALSRNSLCCIVELEGFHGSWLSNLAGIIANTLSMIYFYSFRSSWKFRIDDFYITVWSIKSFKNI